MSVGGGVQRIEITERECPVFGGAEFAGVGKYERLHGTVFGELDPTHRLNADIVNLDKAVRNPRGHVEYRSDFLAEAGLSYRLIGRHVGLSKNTVGAILQRARAANQ
jgi:hypothetical protein